MVNEPTCICECGAGCENEGALKRHQESVHGVSRAAKPSKITRDKRED